MASSKLGQIATAKSKCHGPCGKTKLVKEFDPDPRDPRMPRKICKKCKVKIDEQRNRRLEAWIIERGCKKVMSVNKASKRMNRSPHLILKMINSGTLAAIDIGTGDRHHWRIDERSVVTWILENQIQNPNIQTPTEPIETQQVDPACDSTDEPDEPVEKYSIQEFQMMLRGAAMRDEVFLPFAEMLDDILADD